MDENQTQEETQEQVTSTPAPEDGRVTARTWYPIAEDIAREWQADAVLTSVNGNNFSISDEYPCDGMTNRWHYSFVSVDARMSLGITVLDGEIYRQRENELKHGSIPYTDEEMQWEMDLYLASEWRIDSDEAARITSEMFEEERGEPYDGMMTYVLFNTKKLKDPSSNELTNDMHWVISTDSEGGPGSSFQIDIDARTGDVKEG